MILRAEAELIKIDADEDGWHLRIESDEGDRFDFRFQGIAFGVAADPGLRALLDWRREGEDAYAEWKRMKGEYDLSDAYPPDSPKHPRYHELMSDLAERRKTE